MTSTLAPPAPSPLVRASNINAVMQRPTAVEPDGRILVFARSDEDALRIRSRLTRGGGARAFIYATAPRVVVVLP